jgi:adenine phosphoribosyltransferase
MVNSEKPYANNDEHKHKFVIQSLIWFKHDGGGWNVSWGWNVSSARHVLDLDPIPPPPKQKTTIIESWFETKQQTMRIKMYGKRNMFTRIPNFPKPGIDFVDISPLLASPKAFDEAITVLAKAYAVTRIDAVVGLDARGFLLGLPLAQKLGTPFVMIRKAGKLPGETWSTTYDLEYGQDTIQLSKGAIQPGQQVLIADDILATGGTILAATNLIQQAGASVAGICCFADVGCGAVDRIRDSTKVNVVTLEQARASANCNPLAIPWQTNYVLLYHPSMLSLAVNISTRFHMNMQDIQWGEFPDGFPNIRFPANLSGKRVVFLASMYNKSEWLEQLSVIMVLPRQGLMSLDIILPYFAPATMERIDVQGTLATADTFAQISTCCISPTPHGVPTLCVFDLHNITSFASFDQSKVCFRPLSALGEIIHQLEEHIRGRDYVVVFPDEGSYKRFIGILRGYRRDVVVARFSKVRIGDRRELRLMEISNGASDFSQFPHVLIVDDLVQSGQTLHECHLAVRQLGAQKVYASCTHAVLPGRTYLDFLPGGPKQGLERFFITDSNPQRSNLLASHLPFQVVSLASAIGKDIQQRHHEPNYQGK